MKITVITATYNSGKTLKDTIESVLSQTYKDIEYIVIDGASKDNTLDIVKEYQPKFGDKIKVVSEPDRGLYDAMNKGIALASGDVIGLLNSDDYYTSKDVLSTVSKEISDCDAVYGDVHYIDHISNKPLRYYSSRLFKPWMMRLGFMPAHPSFYCRREAYQKCGTFDTSYHVAADFEQLLRLIFINRIKLRYINKDFVTMRDGGASSSGLSSHKRIFKEHRRAFKKNSVYSNIFLQSLRYLYKIGEIISSKIRYK